MSNVEETLNAGGCLRPVKKKFAVGRAKTYVLQDETGNMTNSTDEMN